MKNFQIQFSEYCFSVGRDFGGANIVTVNAPSAHECQIECQKNPECMFFTYDLSSQNCWLKNAKINDYPNPVCISGPRKCYEGTYLNFPTFYLEFLFIYCFEIEISAFQKQM